MYQRLCAVAFAAVARPWCRAAVACRERFSRFSRALHGSLPHPPPLSCAAVSHTSLCRSMPYTRWLWLTHTRPFPAPCSAARLPSWLVFAVRWWEVDHRIKCTVSAAFCDSHDSVYVLVNATVAVCCHGCCGLSRHLPLPLLHIAVAPSSLARSWCRASHSVLLSLSLLLPLLAASTRCSGC
jgi:hypothetical protein